MSRVETVLLSAVLGIGFMLVLLGLGSVIGAMSSLYGSLILLPVVAMLLLGCLALSRHLRRERNKTWRSKRSDLFSS